MHMQHRTEIRCAPPKSTYKQVPGIYFRRLGKKAVNFTQGK